MKYIKSIYESQDGSPKQDLWKYAPIMVALTHDNLDPNSLGKEEQDGVQALMNKIANAVFTKVFIEPATYPNVKLNMVDWIDGPEEYNEWATEYADGDTTSISTEVGVDFLVTVDNTGNKEYDAMFVDEKYITIGIYLEIDARIEYNREDWELSEVTASLVNCMVSGIWDIELKPEVTRAMELAFEDPMSRKQMLKRGR